MQVGQTSAVATVNVQGQNGFLDAWIDFNGDGVWGGAEERIAASVPVTVGENSLSFAIPASTAPGLTFARFRISSQGGLSPAGIAPDGEVEDYSINIAPATPGPGQYSASVLVDDYSRGPLVVIDFDGDGDQDAVSAASTSGGISWFENDGRQSYTRHTISSLQAQRTDITVADYDNDGDLDVASIALTNGTVEWYVNDGAMSFARRFISSSFTGASSLFAADINADGYLDLVATAASISDVAWFENNRRGSFRSHTVDGAFTRASKVVAADLDRDGDIDLLAAANSADSMRWYENNGAEDFTRHDVADSAGEATDVAVADIDNDGDLDFVAAFPGDDTVAWYENDGGQQFTRHAAAESLAAVSQVYLVDLDGDGDLDILSASKENGGITWHVNDGQQQFAATALSDSTDGVYDLLAADMDGDGDLDVAASLNGSGIRWHENYLAGDYDRSGVVDGLDRDAWRQAFGSSEPADYRADGNYDGIVNGQDYAIWREHLEADRQSAEGQHVPRITTAGVARETGNPRSAPLGLMANATSIAGPPSAETGDYQNANPSAQYVPANATGFEKTNSAIAANSPTHSQSDATHRSAEISLLYAAHEHQEWLVDRAIRETYRESTMRDDSEDAADVEEDMTSLQDEAFGDL